MNFTAKDIKEPQQKKMNYMTYEQEATLFGLAITLVRLDPSNLAGSMHNVRDIHQALSLLPTFDGRFAVDFETISNYKASQQKEKKPKLNYFLRSFARSCFSSSIFWVILSSLQSLLSTK